MTKKKCFYNSVVQAENYEVESAKIISSKSVLETEKLSGIWTEQKCCRMELTSFK
jgi:hypothetical protein